MRTFVIGDIHGSYKKLQKLLNKIQFNYKEDTLITLGDYCDGRYEDLSGHNLYEVIQILNKVQNYIRIKGNHDFWLESYLNQTIKDYEFQGWLQNGGQITFSQLEELNISQVNEIKEFMKTLVLFHETDTHIFVHGGYVTTIPLKDQDDDVLCWDRDLTKWCVFNWFRPNKFTFVGHTATHALIKKCYEPIIRDNYVNLDTGAGYGYKLTAYNLETREWFQE